jgi:NADPH:quinone reductase
MLSSGAVGSLGISGVLMTLGYSAGRQTTLDATDLIWKRGRMAGFSLFAQSSTAIATGWLGIVPMIAGGSVKSIVERVYPLCEARGVRRQLVEDRPFGKVVLAGESM